MMKFIDKFLNSITMYRLMLYGLLIEIVYAMILAVFGKLSYSPVQMLIAVVTLVLVAQGSNLILAKLFRAVTNAESAVITALLLFFVMDPTVANVHDVSILALAAFIAMLSKFIFAIGHKHLFNPVAITAVIFDLAGFGTAIWWVATPFLLPVALVFGLLVVHKIRRFNLFLPFLGAAVVMALVRGIGIVPLFVSWPIVFFGTMMVTEPRTAPLQKREQMLYGGLIGLLFVLPLTFGSFPLTPELSLIFANLLAYLLSSKQVLTLKFKRMTQCTAMICDFAFEPNKKLVFQPGQYLEWTLPVQKGDSRGNRRYFTIASSPTDSEVHLGVRIDREHGSAFKKALLEMKEGDVLSASHISGEFTLPVGPKQKLAFAAGGVGVTPFWSMAQWLHATNQKRDIVFFYGANSETDFAYKEDFDKIADAIGMKIVYVVAKPSPTWTGKSGYLSKDIVESEAKDFAERKYYLSGPNVMVENYKKMLLDMQVKLAMIKTDYFPGF